MTPCLPPTAGAIRELERTIAERREHIAKRNPPGAIMRVMAMQEALELVRICEEITYFETNGNPTSTAFQQTQKQTQQKQ
jgi:cytochrome b